MKNKWIYISCILALFIAIVMLLEERRQSYKPTIKYSEPQSGIAHNDTSVSFIIKGEEVLRCPTESMPTIELQKHDIGKIIVLGENGEMRLLKASEFDRLKKTDTLGIVTKIGVIKKINTLEL